MGLPTNQAPHNPGSAQPNIMWRKNTATGEAAGVCRQIIVAIKRRDYAPSLSQQLSCASSTRLECSLASPIDQEAYRFGHRSILLRCQLAQHVPALRVQPQDQAVRCHGFSAVHTALSGAFRPDTSDRVACVSCTPCGCPIRSGMAIWGCCLL